jgi:tetratricopeptide (TPR) repeat protein
MVTGQKPYVLEPTAPLEALRVVCQELPKRPNQVLKEPGRHLDPDAETILPKALEKDPSDRYQSTLALAEDIERYLSDRPILAHPPSVMYQFRKAVARHKVGFGFVVTVFLLLAVLAATMSVQSARIARERDRAEQEAAKARAVNVFLQETLGSADPYEGADREVTVIEALDEAVEKIDESFAEQPEIEAAVRNTIGHTYSKLARYEPAEPLLNQALEIRRSTLGNEHLDVADAVNALGVLRYYQTDDVQAERLLREALTIRRRLLGEDNLVVAQSLVNLAAVLADKDPEAAEPLYYEAIEIERKFSEGVNPQLATSLHNLALFLSRKGDHESAVRSQREALQIDREVFGYENVAVAGGLTDLAVMLNRNGDYDAAQSLAREALALHRKLSSGRHRRVAYALETLANSLVGLGRYAEAERLFKNALGMYQELLSADHWALAVCRSEYGHLLIQVGRYPEAEEELLHAFKVLHDQLGEQHHRTERILRRLVDLYEAWGKPAEAAQYRASLDDAGNKQQ